MNHQPTEPTATPADAASEPLPTASLPPTDDSAGRHDTDCCAPDGTRILIGSQRPQQPAAAPEIPKPKPAVNLDLKPATAEPTVRKYPPPNTRGQLTPDLELEFAAALGSVPLEEMLAGQQSAPDEAELLPETRCRGTVLAVQREDVFIDLGSRRQGILSLRLLSETPMLGVPIDVTVSRMNPADGLYELVLPGSAISVGDWSEVVEGMVVEARVTGHNKGGLECDVNHLRGFIPAGQASMYRVEDLSEFVGQKLLCVVTEANAERRNLVLSRRAVLEREKAEAREKLLADLAPGQVREGVVRSLQDFGAFVDLGGVDGLIHVSQLSWDRIRHANEVLELGQKVKVKINKIDPETGKIGLGFRDLSESPWASAAQKYPPRGRVKGTISRIMDFGAFVKLEPGVEGLVHISELSHKRVWRPSEVVAEGQEVEVLVLSVDTEQQRISLSLKALEARPVPAAKPGEAPAEPEPAPEPIKRSKTPLKGGIGSHTGGEQFGLKW